MNAGKMDIARSLDMTGLFCPEPVVEASKGIEEVGVGEILEMLADDPSALSDMESWSKRTGHELVSADEEDGVTRFLIRRTS
ncbi:sulfurtransferase TusA family protein [bacterium]|nr:sulfurtransferase TusA family protein [bacterium]